MTDNRYNDPKSKEWDENFDLIDFSDYEPDKVIDNREEIK